LRSSCRPRKCSRRRANRLGTQAGPSPTTRPGEIGRAGVAIVTVRPASELPRINCPTDAILRPSLRMRQIQLSTRLRGHDSKLLAHPVGSRSVCQPALDPAGGVKFGSCSGKSPSRPPKRPMQSAGMPSAAFRC
jgi:hypothetical protein